MRLIKLSANQSSFREIPFNQNGLTLIVGKPKAKEKQSEHTYNGVGKSLLLYLVNFCLGSQSKAVLGEKLPQWSFTLDFKIGNAIKTVTRATDNQEKVMLDGVEIELDKFREWLAQNVIQLPEHIPFLTFRSLIGIFLRPGKKAYESYERLHYSETPYQSLVRNAFLLGVQTDLIREKHDLRQKLENIKELQKSFEKDTILRDYFVGDKDLNIALKETEEAFDKLETDHKNFKVAENYKEVEAEANDFKRQLQSGRNEIYVVENSISQIEGSIRQRSDAGLTQITEVYEAAKVKFPEAVKKELKELAEFHETLIQKRQTRLEADLQRAKSKLKQLNQQLESLNLELNNRLKFLDGHGAFSEYTALSEKVSDKRNEVQKLRDYKRLMKEYKDKSQELKLRLSEENIKAGKYLEEHEKEISAVTGIFRTLAKRIYPDKGSALVITNNDGDNQTRFNIDAKIISDASDGINEAKIFCFDMTVLLGRKNHNINFLFHDSRLFSDIDPRQRAEVFRIAYEHSANANFQYVATVNEDQVETMKPWLGTEYEKIITNNIVLELTDESTAGKLLGVEVDLDYDSARRSGISQPEE